MSLPNGSTTSQPPRNSAGGASGRNGRSGVSASKVVCAHRQGDRVLVLTGERSGERVRVSVESISDRDWPAAHASFHTHGVGRLVHIVPGSETIARTATVPAADLPQMVQAASLLAEIQLPDSVPSHRRAAGVLAGHAEGAAVPALLAAWRGETRASVNREIEETWCTIIGSLAALRGTGTNPAWFADPSDGSISILSGTGTKTTARVVVEDNSSAVLWGEGIAATVGEELDDSDLTPRMGLGESEVDAISSRISGITPTSNWLNTHGPALGALLIAMGTDPALAPLAQLTAAPPKVIEHPVMRFASWLGEGRRAVWVTAAALVLLVCMPIGVAWARVTILDAKSKSLAKANVDRKELDKRAAVYSELSKTRWPITKLLADISQATPLGVVVTDLTISPEVGFAATTGGKGVTINGYADVQSKVLDFQQNLNAAKLFSGVTVGNTTSRSEGGIAFKIEAGVSNPHGKLPENPDWDWAAKNIAERLHGPGASLKTPPVGKPGSDSGAARPSTRRPSTDSADAERKPAERKPSDGVPPELTPEQIAKMDRPTAMREMVSRRTYPQRNPSLDSSTKKRLEEEAERLKQLLPTLPAVGSADKGAAK